MHIKIKTNDIELEYRDINDSLEEITKIKILEIVSAVRKMPTVSAYDALGVPNSRTSDGLRCTYCGANQLVRPNVMCTGKCDNKAMTQFID